MRIWLILTVFVCSPLLSLFAQEIESLEKPVDEFVGKSVTIKSKEGLDLYLSQIENDFRNKKCTTDRKDLGTPQNIKIEFLYACPSLQTLGLRRLVQSDSTSLKDYSYQTRQTEFPVTADQLSKLSSNLNHQIGLCKNADPAACRFVTESSLKSSAAASE